MHPSPGVLVNDEQSRLNETRVHRIVRPDSVAAVQEALAEAKRDFRRIFDRALAHGGFFYLTYHRWATKRQLLAAHPRPPEFLRRSARKP